MPDRLKQLFASARQAQGIRTHTPVGFDMPTAVREVSTARGTIFNLAEPIPNLAAYFDADGRLRRIPKGRSTVGNETVDPLTVARANSRLAAAGAQLLLRAPSIPPTAIGPQGVVVMQREISGLALALPLKLQTVADEDSAPVLTSLPFASATVDWSDESSATAYAANLEIPRDDYRSRLLDGTLDELLTASIIAGVGRIADQALLAALASASLEDFTIAKAAAVGLRFADLRAIVGTNATGAEVGQDGVLRVAGVAGELSDAGTSTFVGDFASAASIFDREVRVVAQKGINGSLSVSVYGAAAALLPDPNRFWLVSA
jgi:hypothetical protein